MHVANFLGVLALLSLLSTARAGITACGVAGGTMTELDFVDFAANSSCNTVVGNLEVVSDFNVSVFPPRIEGSLIVENNPFVVEFPSFGLVSVGSIIIRNNPNLRSIAGFGQFGMTTVEGPVFEVSHNLVLNQWFGPQNFVGGENLTTVLIANNPALRSLELTNFANFYGTMDMSACNSSLSFTLSDLNALDNFTFDYLFPASMVALEFTNLAFMSFADIGFPSDQSVQLTDRFRISQAPSLNSVDLSMAASLTIAQLDISYCISLSTDSIIIQQDPVVTESVLLSGNSQMTFIFNFSSSYLSGDFVLVSLPLTTLVDRMPQSIGGTLWLQDLPLLMSLDGFHVQTVPLGGLVIESVYNLVSLSPLANLFPAISGGAVLLADLYPDDVALNATFEDLTSFEISSVTFLSLQGLGTLRNVARLTLTGSQAANLTDLVLLSPVEMLVVQNYNALESFGTAITVTSDLLIASTGLVTLDGLSTDGVLTSLSLTGNSYLADISALSSLAQVTGEFVMKFNPLVDGSQLTGLVSIDIAPGMLFQYTYNQPVSELILPLRMVDSSLFLFPAIQETNDSCATMCNAVFTYGTASLPYNLSSSYSPEFIYSNYLNESNPWQSPYDGCPRRRGLLPPPGCQYGDQFVIQNWTLAGQPCGRNESAVLFCPPDPVTSTSTTSTTSTTGSSTTGSSTTGSASVCGNGIVEGSEECDTANAPNSGCLPTCQVQSGCACALVPVVLASCCECCGDAILQCAEACDGSAGCSAQCTLTSAGAIEGAIAGADAATLNGLVNSMLGLVSTNATDPAIVRLVTAFYGQIRSLSQTAATVRDIDQLLGLLSRIGDGTAAAMSDAAQQSAVDAMDTALATAGSAIDPQLVAELLTPFLDKSVPVEPMSDSTADAVLAVAMAALLRQTQIRIGGTLPIIVTTTSTDSGLVKLLAATDSSLSRLLSSVAAITDGQVVLDLETLTAVQEAVGGAGSLITVVVTTWLAYPHLDGSVTATNCREVTFINTATFVPVSLVELNRSVSVDFSLLEFDVNSANPSASEDARLNATCSFWDAATATWSQKGCERVDSPRSATRALCRCNHTTDFSVLVVGEAPADEGSGGGGGLTDAALAGIIAGAIGGCLVLVAIVVVISVLVIASIVAFKKRAKTIVLEGSTDHAF